MTIEVVSSTAAAGDDHSQDLSCIALTAKLLRDNALRNRETLCAIDAQLNGIVQKLIDLIPPSLAIFADKDPLLSRSNLKELLKTIGVTSYVPYSTLTAQLHTPEAFGFRDRAHAREAFLELQNAWAGILAVSIEESATQRITIHAVGAAPFKPA